MTDPLPYLVVETPSLKWPSDLQVSSKYFRLFIAADATTTPTEQISKFAEDALTKGMVYFSAWGPGCERTHDIVDETVVASEAVGRGMFTPITSDDTVITTWHDDETLDEAIEFFISNSYPTVSYVAESGMWLFFSTANSAWTRIIREQLRKRHYPLQEPI